MTKRTTTPHSPLLLGRRLSQATSRKPMGFVPQQSAENHGPGELVTYAGESHLLTIGKAGAGKTALAIANLLHYEGSSIVFDSTGGIYEATARRRRELGQEVHVIDLRDKPDGTTGSLNPIDLAARGGSEQAVIARSFAGQVVSRSGNERDSFWLDWAETMIAAGVGYAMSLPEEHRNMSFVFDLFNSEEPDYRIAEVLDDKEAKLNRATRAAFTGLLSLPDKETRPSVIGSTQAMLRLWDSDLVRSATNTTSFDIDALINDSKPLSIYLIVPSYREAFRPLLRLWFSGLLTALMRRERVPALKTLLLSDESASFGKVDAFLTAATQARAFGVQLWTHWQNASQLEIYGKDGAHTLVDNAGVLQLLGAPNRRVAEEFAALVGGIDADTIMAMGPKEQLVMMDGKMERLQRLRYFDEEQFTGQYDAFLKPVPPTGNKPPPPDKSH